MSNPSEELNPSRIQAIPSVRLIQHLEDIDSRSASISASTDIETAMGVALPDDVVAVDVIVDTANPSNNLRYNPDGAATAANGGIPTGSSFTIWGDKTKLDKVRFFATMSLSVSFIMRRPIPLS